VHHAPFDVRGASRCKRTPLRIALGGGSLMVEIARAAELALLDRSLGSFEWRPRRRGTHGEEDDGAGGDSHLSNVPRRAARVLNDASAPERD
jgi:hypothetical protein